MNRLMGIQRNAYSTGVAFKHILVVAIMLEWGLACLFAQESMLVPLQGQPKVTQLMRVVPDGIDFSVQGADTVLRVRSQELVRWGALVIPKNSHVLLSDGSVVVGETTQLDESVAIVQSELWGKLSIPRAIVLGIVWSVGPDLNEYWRFRNGLSKPLSSGVLQLENGDRLRGRLVRQDALTAECATGSDRLKIALSRLQFYRGESQQDGVVGAETRTVVGFRDGSLLVAAELRVTERIDAELCCGLSLRGPYVLTDKATGTQPQELVNYLRFDQPTIRYLSDIKPLGHKHIPYLTRTWDWGANSNVLGLPLSSAPGQLYGRGIGMHSTARLAYAWEGIWDEFQAEVCLDESAGNQGSVKFRIFLKTPATKSWEQAFQSPIARGGHEPLPIRLPLRGSVPL